MTYVTLCFKKDEEDCPQIAICGICGTTTTYFSLDCSYISKNFVYWCENCDEMLLCTSNNKFESCRKIIHNGVEHNCIRKLTLESIEEKLSELNNITDVYKVGILNIDYIVPSHHICEFFNAKFLQWESLPEMSENHGESYYTDTNCILDNISTNHPSANIKNFTKNMEYINKHFSKATHEQREYFGLGYPVENLMSFEQIREFNENIDLDHDGFYLWYSGHCSECGKKHTGYISGD